MSTNATHTTYIDVVLPLQLANTFTYSVPAELVANLKWGQRVVVQFGKNKRYSAIVVNIHHNKPDKYEAKPIESIIDADAIINPLQYSLWQWISQYYMCTIGEVMNASLPSGLKLNSETRFVLNYTIEINHDELNDSEFLLVEALEMRHVLSIENINNILQHKKVHTTVKSLIDKQIILVQEELKQKFKPKIESYVKLTEWADVETNLSVIFDDLKKAPKQQELLSAYIQLSKRYQVPQEVTKAELLKLTNANAAAINALAKKNIFQVYEVEVARLGQKNTNQNQAIVLSEMQANAFAEIKKVHTTKDVCLLHGITGSGKTEVYIELIQEAIAANRQVLFLVPEIALTTQLVNRLKKVFNTEVGVYHSRFNENERVEIWNNILRKKSYKIILGARSSLFLPFQNLGLIIIDEEHDASYKQQDPAPRYNARDTAIYLASLHKAKVLLGSATPSIETYYNAEAGKYGLVNLLERYGEAVLPTIEMVDIKADRKKKAMKQHFTLTLYNKITEALENKQQIILFQNRRGFVPVHECNNCGHVPQCMNCAVSLTYHKQVNLLKCHYCGYSERPTKTCNACGSSEVFTKGFGTEKIEEDIKLLFPQAKVARMDLDTTRSKQAFNLLIEAFENKEVDILIGTQMVTKGLDFDNVSLVGVLDADSILNFPDFRAHERGYQLLSQVSGRAGRKSVLGTVIIQSTTPQEQVLLYVQESNYKAMYHKELEHRKQFNYPPYFRLTEILLKHKNVDLLKEAANSIAIDLQQKFGQRILGPEFTLIPKVRNYYQIHLLLKVERDGNYKVAKEMLKNLIIDFKYKFKSIDLTVDVDYM